MFNFFEGLIENLGVRLVGNFTEKLINFIRDIKQNSTNENNDKGGDSTQIGSSGDSTQIGSSGDSTQIGSSGDWTQIGSSGDRTQIGSSGDRTQIGSSGDLTQIGSSGNSTQIGSSGDRTQIGSSGDCTQIGSSGDWTQIGSSGDRTQIGSSGNRTQIGSSGNSTQIGSSGNRTQIGSSGDWTQIGSSGDSTQIGSSGDWTQIGSSGDWTQIDINGDSSVGFACGYKSIIKAKRGTWISLCEYEQDENDIYIPSFAISAQIGNKDYKDFKGRILKETEYYTLHNKQLYPVDISDDIETIKISEKKREGITIIKALALYNTDKEVYIVKEKELSAHGNTLKEAMEDLIYKKTQNEEIENIVSEIKKTGKVNRAQYRAITGACQYGTNKFCEEHNIQDLEEISLDKLRKILINDYGAKRFWNLIDNKEA